VKNLWKDFSTKGVARVERSGKVGGVGGVDLRWDSGWLPR